jgi:pimeloyl-ACP methyl ester carboxylesterase
MIPANQHHEVQLPAGTIRYREAGEGKPLVFVHGYLANHQLWDGVVDRLSSSFRCLAPDWPLGSHPVAMSPDADLSPTGIASLIEDFLAALELEEVTIVGNDSGGAMSQVLVSNRPKRVSRLVLTNCDSHENFPPGILKALPLLAKLPGGGRILIAPFRIGFLARATFKPFSEAPIPAELIDAWGKPALTDRGVRRDLKKITAAMKKSYTLDAAEKLRGCKLPTLLAWAPADRTFPLSYAERFAADMPNARIVQIPDARTFVPLDQPQRLADEIAAFVNAH